MRRVGWYAIQVETGREDLACKEIERTCEGICTSGRSDEALLVECFSPRYAAQRKVRGTWVDQERVLLPGYVLAVTADPWKLARVLGRVPIFTRMLVAGETFAPLSEADRAWIERFTTKGKRIIPISIAYKQYVSDGGADGVMIHSRDSSGDDVTAFMAAFKAEFPEVPVVLVPTTYNHLTEEDLAARGASVVIHANHFLRATYLATERVAESILEHGRSREADELCLPIKDVLTLIPEE